MVFSLFLKASKIFRSILEMFGNRRVIRKSLMKNWESSEVFGLVNSWAVWPLTTIFGVPGVFLAVSRVFRGIMGCSRGVPGLSQGCSGFGGSSRGIPGRSGVFRILQTPCFSWSLKEGSAFLSSAESYYAKTKQIFNGISTRQESTHSTEPR